MGPKSQKNAGKGKAGEEEKEDALQAVVLADTFETRFSPFILERPRCLLPLVNAPLIEYTLDFLASSGVREVLLHAGSHSDQVEAYIKASKWSTSSSPFKELVFVKCVATSIGDVMRELDQNQDYRLTGDFLVVSGDIVSNFPIEAAVKAHKARRLKNRNAIMTMLLSETSPNDRIMAGLNFPTFIIDPTKDRCLHYEEAGHGRATHARVDHDMVTEMLSEPEIDIRQDLIDCRIDICTEDVLSSWSDNFDHQTPRKDFLKDLLKNYDTNQKTVHTYIIEDHYAARVGDLPSYDKISRDVISRRAFPLCPDNNLFSDQNYIRWNQTVYKEEPVITARSSIIESGTVIGRDTSIGAGSVIKNSVIGRRCQIGKDVNIVDSYIWDDVTIDNDVKILKAIIADESFVGDRCTIQVGALVSFGVDMTAGTTVSSNARLTKEDSRAETKSVNGTQPDNFVSEDGEEEDARYSGLGRSPAEPEFDVYPDGFVVYKMADLAGSTSSLSSDASEASDAPSSYVGSRSESFATTMSDEDGGGSKTDHFHHEATSSIFDRMQTATAIQDINVELMGSRLSHNASDYQVRKAVAVAMMKHIQHEVDAGATAASASKDALSKYRDLVKRGQDSIADQIDFLIQVQRDLTHRSDGNQIMYFVVYNLYDMEVFEEEVFRKWWADEASVSDGGMKNVRILSGKFIEWLDEAESESDEDESDE
jgi:translation initiation factor eIF-2B subunit epsilon